MTQTWQEIHAQHDAVLLALQTVKAETAAIRTLFLEPPPKRILFLGCGSSFMVSRSLATAAESLLDIPSRALPAGECLLHADRMGWGRPGTLVVAVSRSGMTSELVRAIHGMRARGAEHLVSLCMAEGTEPGRLADLSLAFPWAYDQSVCQTRTVATLYAAGLAMLAAAAGDDGLIEDLRLSAERGPALMKEIEPGCAAVGALPWTNAVTLADAELSGIAAEGALAFTEISQLHSGAYPLLDVRHGPMVMIRHDTLVIAALSDPSSALERSLLADVASKGCALVVVSDSPVPGFASFGTDGRRLNIVSGMPVRHAVRGLPLILACQLIAHAAAMRRGVNPDEPDGLDAWIKLADE